MGGELAALVLAFVIVVLPGYLLVRAVVGGDGRLFPLALAAPVGLGLIYLLGVWLTLVRVPVVPLTVLSPLAVIVAWGGFVEVRRGAWRRPALASWSALGAPVLLLGAWLGGMGLPSANLQSDDGANHAIFTALISRAHSLRPDDVLLSDVPGREVGSRFYPLALHTAASMLVQLHVTDAGHALFAVVVVVSCVSLPVGLLLVTRRLFPDVPAAAPVAALLPVACTRIPFAPTSFGLYAMVAGMSMAPGLAAWLRSSTAGRRPTVVAVLALLGLFGTHTSELPLVLAMLVAMAVWPWPGSAWLVARARWIVVALVGTGVLAAPVLLDLSRGTADRFGNAVPTGPPVIAVATRVVTFGLGPDLPGVVLALLALGGVVVALVQRRALGWVVLLVASALTYALIWYAPIAPVRLLTAPWYGEYYRIAFNSALLALPLAAFGFAVAVDAVRATAPTPGARRGVTAVLVGALAIVLIAGGAAVVSAVRDDRAHESVVTANDRAAFEFLSGRVRPGDRVLNARPDGSAWMLPLAGVAPLVGMRVDGWYGPEWTDRWYLVDHAASVGTDARAADLVRAWDVQYVMTGEGRLGRFEPEGRGRWEATIDPALLARSPAYREVFRRGGARVFEVVPGGLARP